MLTLKDRLFTAEDEFLAALMKGSDSISAFYEGWETLVRDLESALNSTNLDPELASLAHTVASRCATLAETSADLLSRNNSLSQELMGELDSLMSELTIHDNPSRPGLSPQVETPTARGPSVNGKRRRLSGDSESHSQCKKRRSAPKRELSPISSHLSRMSSPSRSSTYLPNATLPVTPSSRQSRKRRLSDADICSPARTSKRFHIGPRLHAVSDSFFIERGEELHIRSPWTRQADSDTDASLASSPDFTSLLDLSTFDDFSAPVPIDSLPVVEVPTADIHERSFWPTSTSTDTVLSDLELDTFLRSLLYSDDDVVVFPSPSPSTTCLLDSQKASLFPLYSVAPLHHTPLVDASSHFKDNDDPLLDVPLIASNLFTPALHLSSPNTSTSSSPANDPPSPYVDPKDWKCIFDTLSSSLGNSPPSSYPDSSSSDSDDEVPTPRSTSPAPSDSKAISISKPLPSGDLSIVMSPFMTSVLTV